MIIIDSSLTPPVASQKAICHNSCWYVSFIIYVASQRWPKYFLGAYSWLWLMQRSVICLPHIFSAHCSDIATSMDVNNNDCYDCCEYGILIWVIHNLSPPILGILSVISEADASLVTTCRGACLMTFSLSVHSRTSTSTVFFSNGKKDKKERRTED